MRTIKAVWQCATNPVTGELAKPLNTQTGEPVPVEALLIVKLEPFADPLPVPLVEGSFPFKLSILHFSENFKGWTWAILGEKCRDNIGDMCRDMVETIYKEEGCTPWLFYWQETVDSSSQEEDNPCP